MVPFLHFIKCNSLLKLLVHWQIWGLLPPFSCHLKNTNNVFTYQCSKAAKFLHLVPILHFTAYTLPRVAPTTPPTSYIHHINFSSFEKSNIILLKTFQSCIALHGILAQSKIKKKTPQLLGAVPPDPCYRNWGYLIPLDSHLFVCILFLYVDHSQSVN